MIRRRPPLTALLLAASLAACNSGGSPTAPGGAGTTAPSLPILFTNGGLSASQQAVITELIDTTFDQAAGLIPITGVQAEVTSGTARTIPGWSLGGYALSPTVIEIVVDPAVSEATLRARLPAIAAHEFHHAARFRGPGHGPTLFASMISEGLADHFALELTGTARPPWVVALSPLEITTWLANAEPEFDSTTFNFEAWFFGLGGQIPQWTGYTLGFNLVADYLASNPTATAASLVHTEADAFRP